MSDRPQSVLLGGPSCAGKSPLLAAAKEAQPELFVQLRPLVLHTTRNKRPSESDGDPYHFTSRAKVEAMREDSSFRVWKVHNDLQALELKQLDAHLATGGVVYEGSHEVTLDLAAEIRSRGSKVLTAFLSPLGQAQVRRWLVDGNAAFEKRLVTLMRNRLLRRTQRQHVELSQSMMLDIDQRAKDAVMELHHAHRFDHVLVCHDGEDSAHWHIAEAPIGDAARAVRTFCDLLADGTSEKAEHWPTELLR